MTYTPLWRRILFYQISTLCRLAGVVDPTKPTLQISMILTTTQQVTLTVKGLTVDGKPARLDTLDGVPAWESSDTAVVTVLPAPDGLTCVARSAGPGAATVTVTADADLDVGETRHLTGTTQIEVRLPAEVEAETIVIEEGVPEEIPTGPAPEGLRRR